MAGPSGSVLALENLILWLANLLRKSARHTHKSKQSARVEVLCAAITETSGICQLQIAERSRASNHLSQAHGSTQADGVSHTQQSVTVSLDFLSGATFLAPTVLKIDVESAEIAVLRGALASAANRTACYFVRSEFQKTLMLLRLSSRQNNIRTFRSRH